MSISQQKHSKVSPQPQPFEFYSPTNPFTRISRMPYPDIRANRSRIISQKVADIQRAGTPVSSTGSNHGTIITEDTSHFFSDMSIDIANGDVWNSTGDFAYHSHRPVSSGIRSTAKKYGVWQGGRAEGPHITDLVMADAFPDFTSTAPDDFHLEAPRGDVSIQGNKPNTASLRGRPLAGVQNDKRNSGTRSRMRAEIISKSKVPNEIKQSSFAPVFANTTQHDMAKEKVSLRTSVDRSGKISNYISHASRTIHGDGGTSADLRARVTDDTGSSTERPSTTTLPAKNGRFLPSHRQEASPEVKVMSKMETVSDLSSQLRRSCNDRDGTPTRAQKLRAMPAKSLEQNLRQSKSLDQTANSGKLTEQTLAFCEPTQEVPEPTTSSENPTHKSPDQGTASCNPTQTGTSFFIPWKNENLIQIAPKKLLPFTAQGQVQTARSPHEYVDSIDVPGEEDHIFAMIHDVKDMKDVHMVHGGVKLPADKKQPRTRKRADSGLGDSASDQVDRADIKLDCNIEEKKSDSDLSKTQRLLEQAQRQLAYFAAQNAELVAKNNGATDCITKLQQQLCELATENSKLVAKKHSAAECIVQLQEEISELAIENSELAAENDSAADSIAELNQRCSALVAENNDIINDKSSVTSRIVKLVAECSSLAAQNAKTEKEVQAVRSENTDLQKIKVELEKRISFLEKDNNKNANIHAQHSRNATLEVDLINIGRECNGTEPDQNVSSFAAQKQNLEKKIVTLGLKLQRRDKIIKELSESTQQMELKITSTKMTSNTKPSLSGKGNATEKAIPSKSLEVNQTTSLEFDVGPTAPKVSHNDDEPSCNTVQHHPTIPDDTINHTLGSRASTQYSSVLGHGGLAKHRESVRNFWARVNQPDQEEALNYTMSTRQSQHSDMQDDTVQTIQSRPSSRASLERWPNSMIPDSINGDDTGCSSIGSRLASLNNIYSRTRPRASTDADDRTTMSQASVRRRSEASPPPRPATVPSVNSKKERPTLSSDARRILDDICEHKSKNCSICLRMTPPKAMANMAKRTVRVERPIPVSTRAPVVSSHDYIDDPTTRPSAPPGRALATVLKGLQDEIEHLSARLTETHKLYLDHDATREFRLRKILSAKIQSLVKNIETKKDQVYALYDVLEGQKLAGQEMTEEFVDMTLCDLGIDETMIGCI